MRENRSRPWRWMMGLVLVGWAAWLPVGTTLAREPREKPDHKASKPAAAERANQKTAQSKEDWFERWVKGLHLAKYGKRAPEVRQAFLDVAKAAGEATVEFYVDGRPGALGLIVDSNGYILTKASAIVPDGASNKESEQEESAEQEGRLTCRLPDDRTLPAEIVGVQRDNDLALVKVEASNLPVARWSRRSLPLVGSWVVAPGRGGTVLSVGIVSTTARWIRGGVLGTFLEPSDEGTRILGVNPKGGGARAGLRRGDIIVRVNGREVADVDACIHAIGSYLPGDRVQLTVRRGEEEVEIEAELDSIYDSFDNRRAKFQNALGTRLSERRAGFPAAFEHDLGLAPEQCGGPVVNLRGEVVGINIARSGRVTSLAIPAATVRTVVAEMKAGKWRPEAALAKGAATNPSLETIPATVHESDQ